MKDFVTHIEHKSLLHDELTKILKEKSNNIFESAYDGLKIKLF